MRITQLANRWAAGRRRRDLYRDGMSAFNRGDLSGAIDKLAHIAEDDSLHGRLARFYLAQAHRQVGLESLEAGRCDAAISELRNACRYNPAGGDLARFLAVACASAGRSEAAAGPLHRALAIDRDDHHARVMLAVAQWRAGQLDAAELTLHAGLGAGGDPPEINLHLGLLAANRGDWPRAEAHFQRTVSIDDRSPSAWRYLGLACGAQDRPVEAANHLARAQRLAPSDPHIALELAYARMAAGQQAATPRLKLADLAAAPTDTAGSDDLDRLAAAIIAEPEFIAAFLDLEPSPADQQIFGLLGYSLTRAVAARPGYADLHYYVSRVHRRLGRVADAIDSVEQAIAINPSYVKALIHAGELYRRTAQRGAAAERLRAAIAAGGDYPDVHLLLGELYRELGQADRAGDSYRRALALKPNYSAAQDALAELAA